MPDRVAFSLFAGHLLTIWGLALSNALLAFTLVRTWWRHGLPLGRRSDWQRLPAEALVPLAVYGLCLVASIASSYEPAVSARDLSEIFSLSAMPLALFLVRGEAGVRRIVNLVLAMILFVALQGAGQYFFTERGSLNDRIPGLFSHYMTLSGVLVLGVCLVAARLVTARSSGRWRAASWLLLLAFGGVLYLTLTRHAWLTAVAAGLVAIAVAARRYLPLYLAAVAAAVLLIAMLSPAGWQRLRSIFDLSNPSNYDRVCMAYAGGIMVGERPLLGIGPRMVEERYATYSHPTAPRKDAKHLHNTFIHLAAERGILSLIAYCWLMAASLAAAVRGYRGGGGRDGPAADLYLGVAVAIGCFNLAGFFEANWRDTEIQRLVVFLLAVPFCLSSPSKDLRPDDS